MTAGAVALALGLLLTAVAGAAEGAVLRAPRPGHPATRALPALWLLSAAGPFTAAMGAYRLSRAIEGPAAVASVAAVLVAVVVARLGSLAWGAGRSSAWESALQPLVGPLSWLAAPAEAIARAVGPLPTDRGDGGRLSGDALRALVQAEDEPGPIEDEEMEMIAGIMELGDTRVREVMVPRIDIVAIPLDATLDHALDTIIEAGHSRIPVYRQTVDEIAGLLYAKDLLRAFRSRDFAPDLGALLREPYFVPETKPVDVLLQELQTRRVHMAIIVDEYGGTAGLVTIEDLLEEIVGEIQDEYDEEEPVVESATADEAVVLASIPVDDVNDLLGIELPTDDADTLAGLVFAALGHVPRPGERTSFEDADVEVLDLDGRRIHRVRVVRHRTQDDRGAAED